MRVYLLSLLSLRNGSILTSSTTLYTTGWMPPCEFEKKTLRMLPSNSSTIVDHLFITISFKAAWLLVRSNCLHLYSRLDVTTFELYTRLVVICCRHCGGWRCVFLFYCHFQFDVGILSLCYSSPSRTISLEIRVVWLQGYLSEKPHQGANV